MKELHCKVIFIIGKFILLEVFIVLTGAGWYVRAGDYFRPSALELSEDTGQQLIDLSVFSQLNGQLPGRYYVVILVNGKEIETSDVVFVKSENNHLSPQLTPGDLNRLGVNVAAFPDLSRLPANQYVDNIGGYIPQASTYFDFDGQRLELSIPQIALKKQPREFVDPRLWNQGITALLMNYNFSGSDYNSDDNNNQNYYINLRTGLNIGAWRLRNYSVYSESQGGSDDKRKFSSINTYIQRDIHRIKGKMIVGDIYTPGDIFNNVQFTGAQLVSDDSMLPYSLRGFAPVVRGIAQSNARVTIRQNNDVIYENYVAPGPFEITDLYPTSASGDMEVIITESDGKERKFIQSLSSVSIMQRAGQLRYELSLGRYRASNGEVYEPSFGEMTLVYGLPNEMSLYGGTQLSYNYHSVNAGIGVGLGVLGAIALDTTAADAKLSNGENKKGLSYRIQYSRGFLSTGTSLTLSEYRYSTQNYYSFSEANELRWNGASYDNKNKRSRFQLRVNQSLNKYGGLYLSAWQQDYWDGSYDRTLAASYNLNYDGISYGFSLTYNNSSNLNSNKNEDKQASLNVSIPLDKWLSNGWVTFSANSSEQGRINQQIALSGMALEENNLSYNVTGAYGNKGTGTEGSASLAYKGTSGNISTGYSYDNNRQQFNYGLAGGIVVHQGGVTLSQPLGETIGLVKAPGATNSRIANYSGVRTDWRGYAVIPYIQPYEKNQIILDTETLKDGVDIDGAVQTVIPTRGAVINADYAVKLGYRVLVTLTYQGRLVPFGASASLLNNTENGIVGENGELYLAGVLENENIKVRWGKNTEEQCIATLKLPPQPKSGVIVTSALCH